jgi:hypothetical protein
MDQMTSDQARQLRDQFLSLAGAVLDYHFKQALVLSATDRARLLEAEIELRDASNDLNGLAGRLTLKDLQTTLDGINSASEEMSQAIAHLKDVGKVIAIATAAVSLAGAIVGGDVGAILASINDARSAVS